MFIRNCSHMLLIVGFYLFTMPAYGSNFSQFFSSSAVEKEITAVTTASNAFPACPAGFTAHACARGNSTTLSAVSGKFTGKSVYNLTYASTAASYQALYIPMDYVTTFTTYLQLKHEGMNTYSGTLNLSSYNQYTYVTTNYDWGLCFCKEN